MINQCLVETGAAGSGAVSTATDTAASSSVGSAWDVTSSSIGYPLMGQGVEQALNSPANDLVNQGKIGRKAKHRQDHDGSGGANLLPTRPTHAAHFELQLVEVLLGLCGPSRHTLDKAAGIPV